MKFSSRIKAAQGNRELIFDDAPKSTRIGFYKGVLNQFIISSGRITCLAPLDCQKLHEKFCILIRDEADPWNYAEESAWDGLVVHLKKASWTEFYDLVELAGKVLIEENEIPFYDEKYSFESYRSKVNALFEEDKIGWRLDSDSELKRKVPKSLESKVRATQEIIEHSFMPAREHYKKAIQYLYQHPIDPANSIKEIVSALESIGKSLYPTSSTLGGVIKLLKKEDRHPRLLLESCEKIYAYANATPSIRHGHTEIADITNHEAELVLHACIAFIRYLVDTNSNS
jgi:hypothetical protein